MKRKLMSIILCIGMTATTITNVKAENIQNNSEDILTYIEQGNSQDLSGSSSASSKWYYDTGLTLPKVPKYSKYNFLTRLQIGDILYEDKGGFGITGHIAIVEGLQYDSVNDKRYIRVIEAIDKGVKRGVLDDTRFEERDGTICRLLDATDEQKMAAVGFCVNQLGKGYGLDLKKDTSENEKDWYCSELVWAAYKSQGIDIETSGPIIEPGITPRDILRSEKVFRLVFK